MKNNKEIELTKIAANIKKCKDCRLYKTATKGVPGDGNPGTQILFVGEAPGFHEDQQGLPFVGRAGKLLEFMLSQIGYKREDVWIGNIIKHRPPDNRDPLPDEIKACQGYLEEQIRIIKPIMIVTLGRFSMNYFLPEAKITTSHGKPETLNEIIIYPVYHPAAALRNPQMKVELLKDFLKIPEILGLDNTNSMKDNVVEQKNDEPDTKQFSLL